MKVAFMRHSLGCGLCIRANGIISAVCPWVKSGCRDREGLVAAQLGDQIVDAVAHIGKPGQR